MKRKIITALLSAILAIGLWLYVITVVQPNSTQPYYNIPVALEGERILQENGLMLIGGQNSTVSMTIQGNRSDLSKINSGNITCVADLTKIYEPGTVELPYSYSFPGDIASNALTVQSREPDSITLEIARRITKEVPVQVKYVGNAPDPNMYIVDKESAILDFPKIAVIGPDMVIDQIDHALIEVDLTDRTQSFIDSYRYTLCDAEGNGVDVAMVTTNVTEVRLELKIQRVKDIALELTVVSGGGATEQTSNIVIDPLSIRVSGSEQVLSKLTKINLGTINLGEIPKGTTLTFPINLDEGLTNLTGVTEATVNISFPRLSTQSFTVSNIKPINPPAGMTPELVTKQLKVSIRGPRDLVIKLQTSDVRVEVDLTNMEVGTATVKAQIVLPDKFKELGAVGAYSVTVTLKPTEPTPETTPQP